MQKLDFNKDGKLVAYTDNGCTDGKSATTKVKGTFEVSADVVKFILAKEYDLPATLRAELEEEVEGGYYGYQYLHCFIGNDRQQDVLKSLKCRLEGQQKLQQNYKKLLDKLDNELKRLQIAIDDFNHTRRFYERKIKI